MNRRSCTPFFVFLISMLCVLLLPACSQQPEETGQPAQTAAAEPAPPPPADAKEFAFKGMVEKVDPDAQTVAVHNDDVPGWMKSMTMVYTVDQPDVLKTLKTGDQITAKVYEGNFRTLYSVEVVPAAP